MSNFQLVDEFPDTKTDFKSIFLARLDKYTGIPKRNLFKTAVDYYYMYDESTMMAIGITFVMLFLSISVFFLFILSLRLLLETCMAIADIRSLSKDVSPKKEEN
ncbi:hypothetical protein ABK040_010293 [Willaertia magna]